MRGAVDLAALAAQARRSEQGPPSGTVEVTEQSLQELAQRSLQAPILIVFVAAASAASEDLATRLARIAHEEGGLITVGVCDTDAQPAIAQALQVNAVPTVIALLGGRPAPIFQGSADDEQLRDVVRQITQLAREAGAPGASEDGPAAEAEPEPPLPPLHQEAYDAIERDDLDGAIAAYEQALKENPRDAEAKAGRAQVRLMARVRDADPAAVRAAAAASAGGVDSQSVAAQLAVADLDVLGGAIEDAFGRLIDLVRVTAGDDRDAVRERLVELFDVVGGEDPRVGAARRALAAALF
jgi:putative thioredoxin